MPSFRLPVAIIGALARSSDQAGLCPVVGDAGFEPAARRRGADAPGACLAPPNRRFSQALQSPLLPIAHDPRRLGSLIRMHGVSGSGAGGLFPLSRPLFSYITAWAVADGLLPVAPSLIYGVGGRRGA